jgi:uncharacterized membrane protein
MNRSPGTAHDATPSNGPVRTVGRWLLAWFLAGAGLAHFVRTEEFLAQVPSFLPGRTAIVYVSGAMEIGLAVALVAMPRWRVRLGWVTAGFFVLVFPGNVSQAVTGSDGFGLDSPAARWGRLAFQPLLVVWALWSTGAWRAWRRRRA